MARAVTAILMVAASALLLAACAPQDASPAPGTSGLLTPSTRTPAAAPIESEQPSGFWAIIDESRKNAGGSMEAQSRQLERILSALDPGAVAEFNADFVRHSQELYSWDFWGAAYVLLGGCSDDCFLDFRLWTVAQGQEFFDTVQSDPTAVGNGRLTDGEEVGEAELMSYIAEDVYGALTGADLDEDHPDHQNFYDTGNPTGREWNEDELDTLYPDIVPLDWSS